MKQIPVITDPLGKHWDQPEIAKIELRIGGVAIMSKESFDQLAQYDCSIPSGKYEGKMWKRSVENGHQLCWYSNSKKEGYLDINKAEILVN